MSRTELTRKCAVIMYAIFTVIMLFAIIEITMQGKFFHYPIFLCYMFADACGVYSAATYKFHIEKPVTVVCIIFCALSLVANVFILISKISVELLARNIFVEILIASFLVYRNKYIKILSREVSELQKEQEGSL